MGLHIYGKGGDQEVVDVWYGTYGHYMRFRHHIALAHGIFNLQGCFEKMLRPKNETYDCEEQANKVLALKPHLATFLLHSDGDGEWTLQEAADVIRSLNEVIPILPDKVMNGWNYQLEAIKIRDALKLCIDKKLKIIFA